jgi:hypothetical protein
MTTLTTGLGGMTNVFNVADIMKWLYMTVGIVGIGNNAFVMYVIARSRALKQHPRNWLIFHQSLADLCSAVFLLAVTFRTVNTKFQVC